MASEFPNRIPRAELHSGLEQILADHSDGRLRVKSWRRRLSKYSSSYPIENLQIEVTRGEPLRMVLKDLSPDSLMATAQKVRPRFIYHTLREIETYRTTLRGMKLGTAICYGVVNSPERGCLWLFLERVDGPLLWQVGNLECWQSAARWLARLHDEFSTADRRQHQARLAHLSEYDEGYFATWLARAGEFVQHKQQAVDPRFRRRFGRLMDRYDQVIRTLSDLPTTLIHGEFYPSNIILRKARNGSPICPIDWELAAIAPGLIDLAALTSGEWTEESRRAMIAAYRDALEPGGEHSMSLAGLTEAVDYCRLHISIQLLGWAADWSPPRQHAQNWLREALRLADKLGL